MPPTGRRLDWRAAAWAGVIAGLVFVVLEMMLVPIFMGGSPWGPPRMIAAIALGQEVLPPPDTFDAGIVAVALAVHFALAVVYALILASLVSGQRRGTAILAGSVFGLVLYFINFYLFTAIFPWFAMARNWISIVSHIAFGLVAAAAYVALREASVMRVAPEPAWRRYEGIERRSGIATAWAGPERRRA